MRIGKRSQRTLNWLMSGCEYPAHVSFVHIATVKLLLESLKEGLTRLSDLPRSRRVTPRLASADSRIQGQLGKLPRKSFDWRLRRPDDSGETAELGEFIAPRPWQPNCLSKV